MAPVKRKMSLKTPVAKRRRLGKSTKKSIKPIGTVGKKIGKKRTLYKRQLTIRGYSGNRIKSKFRNRGARIQHRGIIAKYEKVGSISNGGCVYVGHTTLAWEHVIEVMMMNIVKKLAHKAGFLVGNFEDILNNSGTGQQWYLIFGQTTANAAPSNSPSFAATTQYSLSQVAASWSASVKSLLENVVITDLELLAAEYLPAAASVGELPKCWIDLRATKMSIDARSYMKIQNRTASVSGSTSTDVIDLNPLEGKTYFGYGTGGVFKGRQRTTPGAPMITMFNPISDSQGVINAVPDFGKDWTYTEPPSAGSIEYVKKAGGIKIQPGEVQTSFLKSRITIGLNKLLKKLAVTNSGPLSGRKLMDIGTFRFVGLEKMITTASESLIQMNYEVQHNFYTYLIGIDNSYTEQIVNVF